jgi:CNT family concentrative nucleoside transporter
MTAVLQGGLGILVLLGVAFLLSEDRRRVQWKVVAGGLALQILLALVLLKLPASREAFLALNRAVSALEEATRAGTSFVFGYLGGGELPFETLPGADTYILAFRGLPLVLVVSALSSVLFYWGLMPLLVRGLARLLQATLGVGGAEGIAIGSNVFLGMVEAPLFVKHYLARMHRGEIFCLMTTGMATIAGTVMVLYATILRPVLPNAMGHLLVASLLSAPAAVAVARLMIPVPGQETTGGGLEPASAAGSTMEAVTNGTLEGVQLLINIVAMLVVLVALVALVNQVLGLLPEVLSQPLTLQRILGWIMAPVVWLIGIPWQECFTAGALMGTKTVLNEFIAYSDLAEAGASELSQRSRLIMTYAMCGFANLGSLGIMIGGLGALVPERRGEIVRLGLRCIVAGTLATLMTGAVVGIIHPAA